MKKLIFIFAFILSSELGFAHSDSTDFRPAKEFVTRELVQDSVVKERSLKSDTITKKEKRIAKREKRKQKRELNPSKFPRGVAWSSVGLALIGLAKMFIENCK